jgi:hypothetical protein
MSSTRRDFFTHAGAFTLSGAFLGGHDDAQAQAERASALPYARESLQTDVLVAGGGLAGVCAALAAARNGAKVLLIQNRSRLGGNSSSEIRMHVRGATGSPALKYWRESGIVEELRLIESATNPQRSFEIWDFILYDKVLREPNLTLFLDTALINAEVEDDEIVRAEAISPLLEAYYDIDAKYFIDCTGDSILAHAAGAEVMRGREGQDVYGESLAPEKSDDKTMGNSLLFFSKKHEQAMPFVAPPWARKFTKEDFKRRGIRSWEYGYWWIEWGGDFDTIKDNRNIRHELMAILMGIWDYIKNSGEHPTSENWALDWVGMIPGKRENRRVLGEHVMTQQELEQAEAYPDRVAYGGWSMDDHPPGGFYDQDKKPARQIPFEKPYHIPLRSLYSVNRPNMFMAGRNISASHVAFSSARVMATCAVEGQAAGTAAAFCLQRQCLPRDVVRDRGKMKALQQLLLKDDQSLVDLRNADPADLARKATVTASANTPAGPPEALLDGVHRDIRDGKPHQWQAIMSQGEPWLELAWNSSQTIAQIQLTFDSGYGRTLFLSGEDGPYHRQQRGAQAETIADYALEAEVNGAWKEIAANKDNYLRLVRHDFSPITTNKIRIRVQRTQGDPLARLFEMRCYG